MLNHPLVRILAVDGRRRHPVAVKVKVVKSVEIEVEGDWSMQEIGMRKRWIGDVDSLANHLVVGVRVHTSLFLPVCRCGV